MAKKPTPTKPPSRFSVSSPAIIPPGYRAPVTAAFNPAAYRGAAGVAGVSASPRVTPPRVLPRVSSAVPNMYQQNAAQMRAAGATGLGQLSRPSVNRPNDVLSNVVRNNIVNQIRAEAAFGAPSTIPANLIPPSMLGRVTPAAPTTPTAPSPAGSGGGGSSGGGGGAIAGITAAAAAGSPMAQSLLDQLRAGYGAQRSAIDTQLDAAIAAQAARRSSAESAQTAASDQLNRILGELSAGAQAAGGRIADVYGGAGQRLGSLMQDYERMAAERAAGGGRTLAAFGAEASLAQPGGMTAGDYLAAEQAALGRFGALEGAYWGARPQAYQGLASDINTQRALQYEQLMNEIAQNEAAARGQAEADRARISTEEAQAIMDAQMQAWQMQQQMAAAGGGGGGGSSGGGGFSFLPIPASFGG